MKIRYENGVWIPEDGMSVNTKILPFYILDLLKNAGYVFTNKGWFGFLTFKNGAFTCVNECPDLSKEISAETFELNLKKTLDVKTNRSKKGTLSSVSPGIDADYAKRNKITPEKQLFKILTEIEIAAQVGHMLEFELQDSVVIELERRGFAVSVHRVNHGRICYVIRW